VEWALAARVVRRHRGRLVAGAAWIKTANDPLAAFDRMVDALLRIGPVSIDQHWEFDAQIAMFVEDGAGRMLAELLDAGSRSRSMPSAGWSVRSSEPPSASHRCWATA